MQGLLNRSSLSADAVEVRAATMADRARLYALTEHNHRVHFNLDWWSFDNWLYSDRPSDAIWLAHFQNELVGLLLAPYDDGPSVWVRSIAIANGYSADPIALALLKHATLALRASHVEQIAALAHPEWLANLLPRLDFTPLTEIVTLRKSDRALPTPARSSTVIIRDAVPNDVSVITTNDRAAFDPVWWHSVASLDHILRSVAHFIVAEVDGRVVGHAFSDLYGGQGHLIRLVVHPDFQGRGLGERLLTEALNYQLRADAYPFTLNTQIDNISSQNLYHRYGYRIIGQPVRVVRRAISAAK